jgi:hypothetical protein
LLDGPQDPRLPRADVTAFHPYPADEVGAAISAVHGIAPELAVTVFLLPSPPAETLGSYAERDVILLSPGFGPPSSGTVAYVSTHELGHVLTWAYLDARPDRWQAYRTLRGLTSPDGAATPHAERPREVLAEDIRYLFGGPLATTSGTIENHALPTPDLVPGLRELLAGWLQGPPATAPLARSRAFPNPCNPSTTITLELPADVAPAAGSCWIELFDVRGRRVRRLPGGPLAQGRVGGTWDGRDESGRPAASGRYLYVIRGAGLQARGAVLLVR